MHRIQLVALASLVVLPFAADAQASRIPSACTYETCALRVEPRFWSPSRLLRGREGVEIGKLGAFGGGVDTLLAGPDSAANYARSYVKAARTSNTLGLLSAAAYVGLLLHSDSFGDFDNTDIALGISCLGLAIAATPFAFRLHCSLPVSVWFFNGQFAR